MSPRFPEALDEQHARRAALRQLLGERPVRRQSELVEALGTLGFATTQASVSRDLRALAVTKVGGVYRLPDPPSEIPDAILGLIQSAVCAGDHLLVVRTRVGGAQPVGLAIDQSGWTEVLGTIAGDDTIFVAVPDAPAGTRVRARLEKWARKTMYDNTL